MLQWLAQMLSSLNRSPAPSKRLRPLLSLEQLEVRLTPSTYVWKGPAVGNPDTWEVAGNWTSNDGGTSYPSTTSDIANFTGTGTATATMTSIEDISQLNISG